MEGRDESPLQYDRSAIRTYEADVVSVDFDQCLIGVMKNPESDDEDIRWLRCENCEIINPEKEE